jgi:transcriptional regulator with XRE-family HTH domain
MDPMAVAIGAAVRDLRRSRGLTTAQLAERLDLSLSAVSRIERGDRRPSLTVLRRLVTTLQLTPEETVRLGLVVLVGGELRRVRIDPPTPTRPA